MRKYRSFTFYVNGFYFQYFCSSITQIYHSRRKKNYSKNIDYETLCCTFRVKKQNFTVN